MIGSAGAGAQPARTRQQQNRFRVDAGGDVRRRRSISSAVLPVPGPPSTRTVPRRPGCASASGARAVRGAGMGDMTPRGSDKSRQRAGWQHRGMTDRLHVHRYGPARPVQLLAIHGLTGHGRRWETLADTPPARDRRLAPDLIGHGRSSWAAPWTIDANVAALAALLDADADGPVLVVGHSFGGAVALHLAAARPDLVAPAGAARSRGRPGRRVDARDRRRDAGLPRLPRPRGGPRREGERLVGRGATPTSSTRTRRAPDHAAERTIRLAHQRAGDDVVLERAGPAESCCPRQGTPTTLVRATRTQPPYVTDELIDALRRTARIRLHAAGLRLRPHGGAGQARRDRGADPRAT